MAGSDLASGLHEVKYQWSTYEFVNAWEILNHRTEQRAASKKHSQDKHDT